MAKCDSCKLLDNRLNGKFIRCNYRGITKQRAENCNQYVVRKKRDLLGWCD